LDISYPTAEFTKMVKLWESFSPKDMGIVVRHIKRCGPQSDLRALLILGNLVLVYLTTSSIKANASLSLFSSDQKGVR
jgi:hypothetical protein